MGRAVPCPLGARALELHLRGWGLRLFQFLLDGGGCLLYYLDVIVLTDYYYFGGFFQTV